MKHIIVGTNRKESNSLRVAKIISKYYEDMNDPVEIMNIGDLPLNEIEWGVYKEPTNPQIKKALHDITESDGLILIVPEYNGSYPGALKYFIDYWKFPEAFEFRPVCFVGLGGRFGGLRPVEHLQQVFGYRNSHIYPERVFLINVWDQLKDDQIVNEDSLALLRQQAEGFNKFVKALK